MDLSQTIACTALVLMVLISAGHALAQEPSGKAAAKKPAPCVVKPVMSDAETAACRPLGADQKRPARRLGNRARSVA
jgi:hypothetical protein